MLRSSCYVLRSSFRVLEYGTNPASGDRVGVRRFEDLEAWRLADELKRKVYALVEQSQAVHDFRFRDQIRDAAASVPRNLAEGFGRFRPAPFAQFIEIAIGSLMETQCLLKDGLDRRYFTREGVAAADALAERTLKVSTKLLMYLKGRGRSRK